MGAHAPLRAQERSRFLAVTPQTRLRGDLPPAKVAPLGSIPLCFKLSRPGVTACRSHVGWWGRGESNPHLVRAKDASSHWTTAPFVRLISLIHISEPTRLGMISYAVFCLKKKK